MGFSSTWKWVLAPVGLAVCACDGSGHRGWYEKELPDGGAEAAAPPPAPRTTAGDPIRRTLGDAGPDASVPDGSIDASTKGIGNEPDPGILTPQSTHCGDGIRGVDEECDDGNTDETDACTSDCIVRDFLVVPAGTANDAGKVQARYLGWGRHPVAAGFSSFGVVYVEPRGDEASVGIATFQENGVRRITAEVSAGSTPQFFADPVIAKLPANEFAVAWTDFGGDGDALGIALRKVDGATGALGTLKFANENTYFSQYEPDILWTGSELIVAWVDDTDALNGPDIRYRRFDEDLVPLSGEQTLAATPGVESGVSLATYTKGGWVAAWRETNLETGLERGVVTNGDLTWTTQEYVPGPAENTPTIAELDADHLVLQVSGTTLPGDGTQPISKYGLVVLDADAPGVVVPDFGPTSGLGAFSREYRNMIVRADNLVWAVGQSVTQGSPENDIASLLWADWDPATETLGGQVYAYDYLPRQPEGSLGDQRFPASAQGWLGMSQTLVTVWEDHYVEPGALHGEPDVKAQLIPLPMLRTVPDGGAP